MKEYLDIAFEYMKQNPGLGFISIGLLLLTKVYRRYSSNYNYTWKSFIQRPIEILELGLIVWFIVIGTVLYITT